MKVFLISDYCPDSGGAEQIVQTTGDLLERHGHSVRIYPQTPAFPFTNQLFSVGHYLAVRKQLRRFAPDIIHLHNITRHLSASVLLAAAGMNVPIVMTLHDFQIVCPKTSLFNGNRDHCKTGYGPRCFFSSCYPKKFPDRIYQGLKAVKLSLHRMIMRKTVHRFLSPSICLMEWVRGSFHPVDVSLLPNFLSKDYGVSPEPSHNNVLFVGRLIEQKGVDVLLKALDRIRHTVPDIRLKIIGNGPDEMKLHALSESLGLADRVLFLGRQTNTQVMKEYDNALCVVVPSKYVENSSLVVIEAMSKGKIVIASNIGGLPELVGDTENGFLVRPGDPDDLAEKILHIIRNPGVIPLMGSRSRTRFLDSFTSSAYYSNLMTVYTEVMRDSGDHNIQL